MLRFFSGELLERKEQLDSRKKALQKTKATRRRHVCSNVSSILTQNVPDLMLGKPAL
jgi:hypothetical protein